MSATFRIAVAAACLKQPLRKALQTLARLAAEGVSIDARSDIRPEELSQTGARHFRKILDDLNLRTAAVAFPTRRGYAVLEDLDRRVEATKEAMRFARQLGAEVVIIGLGNIPAEDDPAWTSLLEVLEDLGRFGQKAGASLAAKTGATSIDGLGRLLAALSEGSLGVDLDPGRLIGAGQSPLEALEQLGRRVLHVTASDAVRDLAVGRAMEVQLGRGTADYPTLLGGLENFAYRGWLSIDRRETSDPVGEAGDAVQFLRTLREGG